MTNSLCMVAGWHYICNACIDIPIHGLMAIVSNASSTCSDSAGYDATSVHSRCKLAHRLKQTDAGCMAGTKRRRADKLPTGAAVSSAHAVSLSHSDAALAVVAEHQSAGNGMQLHDAAALVQHCLIGGDTSYMQLLQCAAVHASCRHVHMPPARLQHDCRLL